MLPMRNDKRRQTKPPLEGGTRRHLSLRIKDVLSLYPDIPMSMIGPQVASYHARWLEVLRELVDAGEVLEEVGLKDSYDGRPRRVITYRLPDRVDAQQPA
jgi:hypothetical protein